MNSMPEIAIAECLDELRAACRRPIDADALDAVVGWLRPQFEIILSHPEGRARWADHGQQMRDNGRHLGALADFFGYRSDVPVVTLYELSQAFDMVRGACRVRVDNSACRDDGGARYESSASPSPRPDPM
jgi:hypothetical protein